MHLGEIEIWKSMIEVTGMSQRALQGFIVLTLRFGPRSIDECTIRTPITFHDIFNFANYFNIFNSPLSHDSYRIASPTSSATHTKEKGFFESFSTRQKASNQIYEFFQLFFLVLPATFEGEPSTFFFGAKDMNHNRTHKAKVKFIFIAALGKGAKSWGDPRCVAKRSFFLWETKWKTRNNFLVKQTVKTPRARRCCVCPLDCRMSGSELVTVAVKMAGEMWIHMSEKRPHYTHINNLNLSKSWQKFSTWINIPYLILCLVDEDTLLNFNIFLWC